MKFRTTIAHLFLITLAVAAVYGWSLGNDFVYDDHHLIVRNPLVQGGGGIIDAFRWPYYPGLRYYRPVGTSSYLIDVRYLWSSGGDGTLRPLGFHVTNTFLHLLCSLLVYAVFRTLLPRPSGVWSLIGALLFAVHPIATSAVMAISARESVLCLMFSLAGLSFWARSSILSRAAAYLCVALALFSKEMAVALPPVLFAFDLLGRQPDRPVMSPGRLGGALLAQLPCVVVVVGYLWIRSRVLSEIPGEIALGSLSDFLLSFVFLLQMTCWPAAGLLYEPSVGTWLSTFALSATVILLVVILARLGRIRVPRIAWFWPAWTVLFYLPTSNIILQETIFAERYLYLPLVGIVGFLMTIISAPLRRQGSSTPDSIQSPAPGNSRFVVVAFITVLILGGLAVGRTGVWKSDDSFYANWLRHEPDSSVALYGVAKRLDENGDIENAIAHFQKSVENGLYNHRVRNDFGVLLEREGQLEKAEEMFREAIRINPRYVGAIRNLSRILANKQHFAEAVEWYEMIMEEDPDDVHLFMNHATLLVQTDRESDAAATLRRAVSKYPRDETVRFTLARLLSKSKNTDLNDPVEVLRILSPMTANESSPIRNRFDFWLIVGDAFLKLNRHTEADKAYQNALTLLDQSGQHELRDALREKLRQMATPPEQR